MNVYLTTICQMHITNYKIQKFNRIMDQNQTIYPEDATLDKMTTHWLLLPTLIHVTWL